MFGFFESPEKKMRENAARWLEQAAKVWNFRRDVLGAEEARELNRRRDELSARLRERAGADQLKASIEGLEGVLRRTGGAIYPLSSLKENVEFFLVAAIVILGIRTYFLKPMVIPTNSMWPTYYGLTAENFPPGTAAPGWGARLFRLAAYGAVRKEIVAPKSGEVSVLLTSDSSGLHPLPMRVDGRSFIFFPAKLSEYTFFVDDEPVKIRLNEDFHDFDRVFMETWFPQPEQFRAQLEKAKSEGAIKVVSVTANTGETYQAYRVPLGRTVQAGDPLVRFDLMKGDMLVIDCVSYHFVRPKIGSGFVFETGKIPQLLLEGYPDEYFIKRLAGLPGDRIEIREPAIYRNGKPIEGAAAFEANARREGLYRGYFNDPMGRAPNLRAGVTLTVPPRSYLALGDNSLISEDGRYWGFVPDKEVMGRPLFIYYPFTRRWGPAK
ncbi:MAG TPA: signal peptidase I [Opitutaceae bacterium]|nr:signal peptidase I [Opitutaceae bacterium]